MGRRRFIKTAAAIGVPASTLQLGSQEALASEIGDPSKEVSYVHRMKVQTDSNGRPIGRKPIYKTITRDRWAVIEASRRAKHRIKAILKTRFQGITSVTPLSVEHTNSPIGYAISVRTSEISGTPTTNDNQSAADAIKSALPETVTVSVGKGKWKRTVQDIPVLFEEDTADASTTDVTTTSTCKTKDINEYSTDWDGVPGGCALNGYSGGIASGCSSFYNTDKDTYQLVTAGHVVQPTPSEWGNPTLSSTDGFVEQRIEDGVNDFALLGKYPETTIETGIRNDRYAYTDYNVYGSLTDYAIEEDYAKGTKTAIYQGVKSGRQTADVQQVRYNDTGESDSQVQFTQKQVYHGDSGGVIFDESSDGEGAYIMGIINTCFGNYGDGGSTAATMEDHFPGYFH